VTRADRAVIVAVSCDLRRVGRVLDFDVSPIEGCLRIAFEDGSWAAAAEARRMLADLGEAMRETGI
jgi:hypothetical protein